MLLTSRLCRVGDIRARRRCLSCLSLNPLSRRSRLLPPRPAWVEIDLGRLKQNFELINRDKPAGLQMLSVVKDEAYGHGALPVARTALACGAEFLALSTLEEAVALRDRGVRARLLLLGDREERELPWCIDYDLTCCVSEPHSVAVLGQLAARAGKRVPVHLKINTGMNRYGVRWNEAAALAALIGSTKSLLLEGVLSHFAQSDEADKTFALLQLARFERGHARDRRPGPGGEGLRHLCNSGGFLDLPQAHFDMVRLGILPLGVFPSSVCRRIPGIEPVMTVKARIVAHPGLAAGRHGRLRHALHGAFARGASRCWRSATAMGSRASATRAACWSTASGVRWWAAWPWTPSRWTSPMFPPRNCGTRRSSWAGKGRTRFRSMKLPS